MALGRRCPGVKNGNGVQLLHDQDDLCLATAVGRANAFFTAHRADVVVQANVETVLQDQRDYVLQVAPQRETRGAGIQNSALWKPKIATVGGEVCAVQMSRRPLAEDEEEISGCDGRIVETEFQARHMAEVVEKDSTTLRSEREQRVAGLDQLEEGGCGGVVEDLLEDFWRQR